MEKHIITRILSLVCLVLCVVAFVSCDDENDDAGQVELHSFGPAGVKHGEEITFIGENLNKVTSIVFRPSVEVPSSAFTSVGKERITLNVPDAAEAGTLILKTPDGDIETKTSFNLEVPVVISAITPEAKPGTNITITGEKVNWIESIAFASDLLVEKSSFVSQSATELVVTVPMEAQTGFLTFSSGGTEPLIFNSSDPLTVKLPLVAVLDPSAIRHEDNLTLTGTDLDLVTRIDFSGGASVLKNNFVSQSETEIVVAVPRTTVTGKLTLTAPSGLKVQTTNALSIVLPNVTAFSPSNTLDHNPGVTLTLTGTDLDLVAKIAFPKVAQPVLASSFISQSDTEIVVEIPAGAEGGTVSLTTIHDFVVPVTVPFGNQLQLVVPLYDDGAKNGFQLWGGWGSATDWSNTEQVRLGTKAIKADYNSGNWSGAAQFGGGNVSTTGTAFFAFSVYGGPGTEGKKLQLLVKRTGGEATKQVTIQEGEWTDFAIPLSELGSPANVTEVFFQNADFTGIIYIDHVGLK
jgi:hypothetical protein